MTRRSHVLAALVACDLLLAARPTAGQESQVAADLRREREQVAESCSRFAAKAIGGCAYTLITSSPFHVALGNLAPLNGFGFGLAFSERYTPNESWRMTWSADAVAAMSGAYRGGAYMKLVHTPDLGIVVRPAGGSGAPRAVAPRDVAVLDVFAQTTSLETLNYFGPGQDSTQAGRSVFGEGQTLVGTSAIYPLTRLRATSALRLSLLGGITGRFVDIRSATSGDVPSIEDRYAAATVPGLARQSGFVEFREGLRITPSVANGRLRLNYLASAQQFRTSHASQSSFNRWTIDLQHEIPLYRVVSSTGPREFNGPNECARSAGATACPAVQWSRNREGAIGLRLVAMTSSASGGNQVPFYFQPTLGGSDINGERWLASFADYRFRGPNLLALQESVEHALWGPIGVFAVAEQGKVAQHGGDLGFSGLSTSATVGLTLRAGGFPMLHLSFSWGAEGHHISGAMNSSLLGGSSRPSLY